ncbi:MAG TPA: tetratricopeptide repeat protein [Gemmataceae bacterium]|nr:tetratricopeptide repeat protein [Gemmataceae bacterium]
MFARHLFTFCVILIANVAFAQESTPVVTHAPVSGLEPGIGFEHRKVIEEFTNLAQQGKLAEVDQACDEVIAAFQKLMTDPKATYLSFANKAEFEYYQKANPKLGKVEWLDYAYGEALHYKTFVAAERKQYADALEYSRVEIEYRPLATNALTEQGFILNRLGRLQEGLESYEQAVKLAEQFASNQSQHGVALRGVGATLIDLGRLDEAKAAYEQSLKVEPNNKLALSELEYIRKLKEKENSQPPKD